MLDEVTAATVGRDVVSVVGVDEDVDEEDEDEGEDEEEDEVDDDDHDEDDHDEDDHQAEEEVPRDRGVSRAAFRKGCFSDPPKREDAKVLQLLTAGAGFGLGIGTPVEV